MLHGLFADSRCNSVFGLKPTTNMRSLIAFTVLMTSYLFAQWSCGDTLIDIRDGKKYTTILIGSQCWMQQNLNLGKFTLNYSTGVPHSDVSNNGIIEKYCQQNDTTRCDTFGGLYEWREMMAYIRTEGAQGICPSGWHMPTLAEWQTLIAEAGNNSNPLKMIGMGFGSGTGTNTTGFSALPGGDRDAFGDFYGTGLRYIFWTSTERPDTQNAWHITLRSEDTLIEHLYTEKRMGFSCRCIRNTATGFGSDPSGSDLIRIYPIPASTAVTVDFFGKNTHGSLRLLDLIGNEVLSLSLKEATTSIDLSALPAGVYVYRFEGADGEMFAGKLLKE